jgi:hypothetical protein
MTSRKVQITDVIGLITHASDFTHARALSADLENIGKELELKKAVMVMNKEDFLNLQKATRDLYTKINPVREDHMIKCLIDSYGKTSDKAGKASIMKAYMERELIISKGDEGVAYRAVKDSFDRFVAQLGKIIQQSARSNRAARAKLANDVFSVRAGQHTAEGTALDQHGNPVSAEFDLGRDGAYDGLTAVIIQLYTGEEFDGSKPIDALTAKGFDVVHYQDRITNSNASLMPPDEKFDKVLGVASQVWVISGSSRRLTPSQCDIIVKHWKKGTGVYVFGDNMPFYADANPLLEKMDLKVRLSGNNTGSQVVNLTQTHGTVGLYSNHLLSTGLVNIYEGITVSYFKNKKHIADDGFSIVLCEHEGEPVVIARTSIHGCGPVIVDGAFTKLYCQWTLGGSARLVKNCACYLSTILSMEELTASASAVDKTGEKSSEKSGEKSGEKSIETPTPPVLTWDGAYEGECSIMFSDKSTGMYLLAKELADYEANTDDFSLDNPFSLGYRNLVFASGQLVGQDAMHILDSGMNPFTREKIFNAVPLVSLTHKDNYKILTPILCDIFMGGLPFHRRAYNIFVAVMEEMLQRGCDCPDALEWMILNIMQNVQSSPDMGVSVETGGVSSGIKVPLKDGIRGFLFNPDDMAPIRRRFGHTATAIRLFHKYGDSLSGTEMTKLCQITRRGYLKILLDCILVYAKKNESKMNDLLESLLYDCPLGIPIIGTTKLVTASQLEVFVEKSLNARLVENCTRTAKALGVTTILYDEELTLLLGAVYQYSLTRGRSAWHVRTEDLITRLKKTPMFKTSWDHDGTDSGVFSSEEFASVGKIISDGYHVAYCAGQTVPFVTPMGPSVYRATCGKVFGNPSSEVTDEYAEAMKKRRNEYFVQVYGSDGNGYPTKTSSNYNLHRAIQTVLNRSKWKTVMEFDDEMRTDVALYLKKDGKGNIHIPQLQTKIDEVTKSYLVCRRAGMQEPTTDESEDRVYVRFVDRVRAEQVLLLATSNDTNS